ncbi:MAG: phosphate/phosphite/phosphonate ABC transporter substrate-binding protein, partial [Anaerolineae bacterium]
PQVNGKTEYYAYVIVSSQSPYISLDELRGKTFAFSDPLSNSGHLALLWVLQQRGETAESFFQKTIFTYSHDNSIQAVVDHLVDGAIVDSLVYDALVARDPTLAAQTRIIQRIGPFGIPPVVVHPDIDPDLKQALLDALLTMHQDPQGRRALADLHIDRFVLVDSSAYDSIRQMASALRGWDEAP